MKTHCLFIFLPLIFFSSSSFSMYAGINATNDVCNESNGTAIVYAFGGSSPYTYNWSNGATNDTLTGLAGGTVLTVWVYDSAGDSAFASVTIPSQSALTYSGMTFGASQPCEGQCNGEGRITTYDLGGTEPYSAWFDGVQMDDISFPQPGFSIGNVCWNAPGLVYVEDALGCSVTWNQSLYPTPAPVINNVSFTGACNNSDGSATLIDNSADIGFNYYYNYYDSSFYPLITNTNSNIFFHPAGIYYAELVTYTGHFDQDTYQYITTICYSDTQQFTIPDLGSFCENVSGIVYHDDNLNCTQDSGEMALQNVMLTFNPGSFSALTGSQGNYSVNLPSGTYDVAQSAPYPVFQTCPPINQTLIVTNGGQIVNYNFADTTQTSLDLAIFLSATTARPGFNFTYHISAGDLSFFNGGQSTIIFNYDSSLQFISAAPAPASQSAGQITWDINSISLNSPFGADVVLSVPSNMSLGTSLNASANITTVLFENNLSDNTDQLTSIVVGSFDPNEKNVRGIGAYPGPQITASEDLDYTIQFQNTGTDTAFNVIIYDTLSPMLDLTSVFVTYATHEYNLVGLEGHVLRFLFSNILLPDSGTNEPASHGYVDFRVSQQPGNFPGTVISNRGAIVFDFNPAVLTNDAIVNVCEFSSTSNNISICNGDSIFAGGEWQHEAGTYLDHYPDMYSCDSTVTTELNVVTINDSILVTDNVLTSLESNATYQWIDCNLGQEITGATNQSYTEAQSGSYAVQITTPENCSMQSGCAEVIGTGIISVSQNDLFSFYPNPATDHLIIHSENSFAARKIFIRNSLNQIVMERNFSEHENRTDEIDVGNLPNGMYVISMLTIAGNTSKCFVKERP